MATTKVEHYLHVKVNMRIVFMGTPSYATTILKALMDDAQMDVVLVVTQEDKPVGRKQLLTPPHIKAWLQDSGSTIEMYQPKSLRTDEAVEKIASCSPDFIIVAAYGKLLPKAILEIAPCINLHASLLPKYRGASPIQSTLLHNDLYAGVTSMLMEEGLDTGAMLGFTYYPIASNDNAGKLFDSLAKDAASLTLTTLKHFNVLSPLKQISANSSHCKKITKEEGEVSFEMDSKAIMTQYRALAPWPGIFLASGLKLLEIEKGVSVQSSSVGTIQEITKEGIVVACNEGTLLLKSVQPSSKSAMNATDYVRGKRLGLGDTLA